VHRMIVAVIAPANTPHGYNWTFAFPMLLFIVIAAILYALFSRPHRRVPARRISAVAAGVSLAGGGGATESHHEPSGAHVTATTTPAADGAGESEDGSATPPADTGEGSEASE